MAYKILADDHYERDMFLLLVGWLAAMGIATLLLLVVGNAMSA